MDPEESQQVLSKKKLRELVTQIHPNERMDPDVEGVYIYFVGLCSWISNGKGSTGFGRRFHPASDESLVPTRKASPVRHARSERPASVSGYFLTIPCGYVVIRNIIDTPILYSPAHPQPRAHPRAHPQNPCTISEFPGSEETTCDRSGKPAFPRPTSNALTKSRKPSTWI